MYSLIAVDYISALEAIIKELDQNGTGDDSTIHRSAPTCLQVGDDPKPERPRQPGGAYKAIQPHEVVYISS